MTFARSGLASFLRPACAITAMALAANRADAPDRSPATTLAPPLTVPTPSTGD